MNINQGGQAAVSSSKPDTHPATGQVLNRVDTDKAATCPGLQVPPQLQALAYSSLVSTLWEGMDHWGLHVSPQNQHVTPNASNCDQTWSQGFQGVLTVKSDH
jgi:hypothetical protein